MEFERHGEHELERAGGRLGRGEGRQAVGCQQCPGPGLVQRPQAGGQGGADQRCGGLALGCSTRRGGGADLLQGELAALEADDVEEGLHRGLGRGVGGDAGVGQEASRGLHRGLAEPGREEEAAGVAGLRLEGGHGLGVALGRGHDRRREEDQHGVAGRVAQERLDRGGEGAGCGFQAEILGAGGAMAMLGQEVGREEGGAAAVADDGEAALAEAGAAVAGAGGERAGGGEQLLDAADPEHAGAAEGGLVGVVVGAQPGRVVIVGQGGVAAAADGDHRLGAGGGTGSRHEAAGVADAFQLEEDDPGRGVRGPDGRAGRPASPPCCRRARPPARSRCRGRRPSPAWRW